MPRQLPADIAGFTGRAKVLQTLDGMFPAVPGDQPVPIPIAVITGMAGVGKTAVAVHWAHRVSDRFPDGQLHLNLNGHAPCPPPTPIEALARLLHALGVTGENVPVDVDEAAAMYRSLLADKQMLVVLDNAAGADQVRPLLPGAPGCLTLVTSRDQLSGLVASEGARWLSLDALPGAEARTLLSRVVGAERMRAEPEAAAKLAELCGYLPLALRIAAANLATRPRQRVADHLTQLRGQGPLGALAVAGDPRTAVAAAFDLSYTRLSEAARQSFRLLGLAPGQDITVEGIAVMAEVTTERARQSLAELARAHLVEEHIAGRYSCHDLLRAYAAERAAQEQPEAVQEAARNRLLGWYLSSAQAAAQTLFPEMLRLPDAESPSLREPQVSFDKPARAQAWLEAEQANLVSVVTYAAEHGPRPVAWRLAHYLRGFWWQAGHPVEWLTTGTAAERAARRAADQCGQAAALGNSGAVYGLTGQLDRAVAQLRRALALNRQLGRLGGETITLSKLGMVYLELGRLAQAERCCSQALSLHRRLGSQHGAAGVSALNNLGIVARDLGRLEGAYRHASQALALFRDLGSRTGQAGTLETLATVHRDAGRYHEALEAAQASARLASEIGERRIEAAAHNTLASVHRRLDRPPQALGGYQYALELTRQTSNPELHLDALLGLAGTQCDLGQHDQAQAQASQALNLARAHGYRLREGRALTTLAGIHLRRHDHAAAHQYAKRALANHRRTGHRLGEADARVVLGQIRFQAGDICAGRDQLRRANDLYAAVGAPINGFVSRLVTDPVAT